MRWRTAAGFLLALSTVVMFSGTALASTTRVTVKFGTCTGGGTEFCFSPESASVVVKHSVVWTNQSGFSHTVTRCTATACPGAPSSTGKDAFDLSLSGVSGSHVSHFFKTTGTYYYYCKIHGYTAMHGKIVVKP
jgi:plastocyanin